MSDDEMISHLRDRGYTVLSSQGLIDLKTRVRSMTLSDAAEFVLNGYTRSMTGLQIATKLKVMSRKDPS